MHWPSGDARHKTQDIARPPTHVELADSWCHARELDLKFETASFVGRTPFGIRAMFAI